MLSLIFLCFLDRLIKLFEVAGKYPGFIYAHNAYNCARRPTLKDDERFRNGLVHDVNEFTMNTTLFMYAKSIYMNAKSTQLNTNINLKTMLYDNSCFLRKLSKLAK